MARTFVMVRDLDGTALQRIDANRILTPVMLQLRTRLVVRSVEMKDYTPGGIDFSAAAALRISASTLSRW